MKKTNKQSTTKTSKVVAGKVGGMSKKKAVVLLFRTQDIGAIHQVKLLLGNVALIKRMAKEMRQNGFDKNTPLDIRMVSGGIVPLSEHDSVRWAAAVVAGVGEVPVRLARLEFNQESLKPENRREGVHRQAGRSHQCQKGEVL